MSGIPALIDMMLCPGDGAAHTARGVAICTAGQGMAFLGPPRKARVVHCDSDLEWPVLGPPELVAKLQSFYDVYPVTSFVCRHQIIGD